MSRLYKYVVFLGIFFCSLSCTSRQLSLLSCGGTQIKAVCLAHYSDSAGVVYVTQQNQTFCPSNFSLSINAREPQGQYSWHLNENTFSVSGPDKKTPQGQLFNKSLLQSVFYSMSSAVQMLSDKGSQQGDPVKLEGQWYTPFTRHYADTVITVYQSKDTGKFDCVMIQDKKNILLARSYNFVFDSELQKNIPTSIDVFNIMDGVSVKKLLLKIQYTNIEFLR